MARQTVVGMPALDAPMVDPETGVLRQPWIMFLCGLFWKTGQSADAPYLNTGGNSALSIADGGTGAITAPLARTALGAAESGANEDITSLTGLTTALPIGEGGTGAITAAAARTALGVVNSKIAQVVNFETGAVATGTTAFPVNNVIPVNTAGDQYMAATITPTNAASTLLIDVAWNGANSTFNPHGCALFQDAVVNALAAVPFNPQSVNQAFTIAFRHKMIAGTTSATTFKVRAGSNAGPTTTFNGQGGAGLFGGVLASSITIWEILP